MDDAPGSKRGSERGARDIVVVASAFGADLIRRAGHASMLPALAGSGIAGFEVRRELIAADDDIVGQLGALRAPIADAGLYAVYSTPDTFFDPRGGIDLAAIKRALDEAHALGARLVKLQLGRPMAGWEASLATLENALGGSGVGASRWTSRAVPCGIRVVVENGQSPAGGALADALAAFAPWRPGAPTVAGGNLPAAGTSAATAWNAVAVTNQVAASIATDASDLAMPHMKAAFAAPFGMTFDVGNWHWTGVEPLAAACTLREYVDYIHVKGVVGDGARRFAVAPSPDDATLRAIVGALPAHAPIGIEFPLLSRARSFAAGTPSPASNAAACIGQAQTDAGRVDPVQLAAFADAVRYHARWLSAL